MLLMHKKNPDGLLLFSVFVEEYPDEKFGGYTPKQMLESFTSVLQNDEISRKSIEHGPKKYPGLEFENRNEKQKWHSIVVIAGPRLYSISVTAARNEKLLERPEVAAFFDSFVLGK